MVPRTSIALLFVFLVAGQAFAQCPVCPSADEIAVQALLDAAAANGGGVVQLDARVYETCGTLLIGSNTHLRGAGRGATIIRGAKTNPGTIVQNAYVNASIATVGSTNVTVSDLTLDHATCERNSNGIAFMPAGLPSDGSSELYRGSPTTQALLERVEVLGSPSYHSYMIWNLRGQHIKIVNNWLNGGASSMSYQEGIESYGGHDVVISGNTVRNIGYACLNLGAGHVEQSDTFAITATNNYLTGCEVGINLTTWPPTNMQLHGQISTRLLGNVVTAPRSFGIDVAVAPNTIQGDLMIANNTIRDINASGSAGIRLRWSGGAIDGSAVVANTIQGNHIENIRGSNGHAIRLLGYHNTRILGNTFTGIDNAGVYAMDANDIEISGNQFRDVGLIPIQLNAVYTTDFQRFIVERNTFRNWGGPYTGILIYRGKVGTVRDNILSRSDTLKPSPIVVSSGSCSVTIANNVPWYHPTWVPPNVPVCP